MDWRPLSRSQLSGAHCGLPRSMRVSNSQRQKLRKMVVDHRLEFSGYAPNLWSEKLWSVEGHPPFLAVFEKNLPETMPTVVGFYVERKIIDAEPTVVFRQSGEPSSNTQLLFDPTYMEEVKNRK